jgi:hypothetical protein
MLALVRQFFVAWLDHENMRVRNALLETERQEVKLLITMGNATALWEHAARSMEDLRIIRAERAAAVTRRSTGTQR